MLLLRYGLFLLALACGTEAFAAPIHAVVGEKTIYLYWESDGSGISGYRIERSEGAGTFTVLALVAPVSDPKKAREIMAQSPDEFSRVLTIGEDFPSKVGEYPELDRALTLASVGYAQVRARGYLDRNVRSGRRFRYRVTAVKSDGTESAIGNVDAESGVIAKPSAPEVSVDLIQQKPVINIISVPLVRYNIERAELPDGPFQRITFVPLVSSKMDESLYHEDNTAALDGRVYYYRVVPQNAFNLTGLPSAVQSIATPDLTAPDPPHVEPPINLSAAVRLNWEMGREADIAGYHVYRSEILKGDMKDGRPQYGPEQRLTDVLLATGITVYEDSNVTPGQIYQYTLTATDSSGNESKHSPPLLARPRDTQPPAQPRGLSAEGKDGGQVLLTWTANSEADLYAYRLYRGADTGKTAFVLELPVESIKMNNGRVMYNDQIDAKSQATYHYMVSAVDSTENESPLSEQADVRLPDHVPPLAPIIAGLEAGDGFITIKWEGVPDKDVQGYRVYRETDKNTPLLLENNTLGADVRSYTDKTIVASTVYRYSVSAVDISGNEGPLSEVRSASAYSRPDAPAPTRLKLSADSGRWMLSWETEAAARGFIVYVSSVRDGNYQPLGNLSNIPSAVVPAPVAAEVWYRVQAVYENDRVSPLSDPLVSRIDELR